VKIRFVVVMLACLALICRIGYGDSGAGFSLRRASARPVPAPTGKASPARQGGVERAPDRYPHPSDDHIAGKEKTSRGAGLARPNAPPLTNPHHHGANSAVITGSTHVANRNTGKLDGAEVHRRP
jgi:hypothetical protein